MNKYLFFVIILLFYVKANQCDFRDSSTMGQHYLSINTTLNCENVSNVKCSHHFNDTCIYVVQWLSNLQNICNANHLCCIDVNQTDYHNVVFVCQCNTSRPTIFNDSIVILTDPRRCPYLPPKSTLFDIIMFNIFFGIFLGVPSIILLAMIVYAFISCFKRSRQQYYIIN